MDNFIRTKLYLALIIIVVVGLLAACSGTNTTAQQPPAAQPPTTPTLTPPTSTPEQPSKTPDRVDVVYFYRGTPPPCHCMQVVGDNIKGTVEVNFGDKLASGKLTFKMLASESKANADMVRKYKAPPFGLFVTVVKGNAETIYPIEDIWGLTGDEDRFKEFVKSTIEKSLKGQL